MSQQRLNPASILNARPYNTPLTATNLNICKAAPDRDGGPKCVPLYFEFSTAPGYIVNLANGGASGQPLISQICAVYVDNTNSAHDVNIIFPDTGFTLRVPFGTDKMCPVLTGTGTPLFYVMLDDNGNTNAQDTCAVYALNQYLPEFSASSYVQSLAFGYGQYFELQPQFASATNFTIQQPVFTGTTTIIPHSQWYLIGMNVSFVGQSSAATPPGQFNAALVLFDAGVPIWQTGFTLQSSLSTTGNIINITGINYQSSGNGPLTAAIPDTSGISFCTLFYNMFGGVLVN